MLGIHSAHQDNIKKVRYLNDVFVVSGSADRTVKLWDLRNTQQAVSTVRLGHAVEDMCPVEGQQWVVANGNVMSVLDVSEGELKRVTEYQAF